MNAGVDRKEGRPRHELTLKLDKQAENWGLLDMEKCVEMPLCLEF